jgi:GTP-binding protein
VIAQGGFGGRGNESFKSSTLTTPLIAEYGTWGEVREVELELKLLADVGLVGLPSVGKSTLLSVLTKAKPKVASYPFTTLEPHLGVMSYDSQELIIADLPGIIEGAHQGRGLGDRFLKHIEHTQVLVYVLALPDEVMLNPSLTWENKGVQLVNQLKTLTRELEQYQPSLLQKKSLVVVNKTDLVKAEELHQWQKAVKSLSPLLISAKSNGNIDKLKQGLLELVNDN